MSAIRREHHGRTIRHEITIGAKPQAVWEAWARHDRIDRWFVDRAEGDMTSGATVKWFWNFFGVELPVHVFEARPGEYLAFGGPEGAVPSALQEIWVRQAGGATVLRLANSGFRDGPEWDEEYCGVDSGWRMALATLKHWLEHYAGASRTHLFVLRPASFEYAELAELYATRTGLARWFATSVDSPREVLEPGDVVRIEIATAGTLTGTVLAKSPSELCVAWSELCGVLTFKAFRQRGAGRCVALSFNGWGLDAALEQRARLTLDRGVVALAALLGPARSDPSDAVPGHAERGQA